MNKAFTEQTVDLIFTLEDSNAELDPLTVITQIDISAGFGLCNIFYEIRYEVDKYIAKGYRLTEDIQAVIKIVTLGHTSITPLTVSKSHFIW